MERIERATYFRCPVCRSVFPWNMPGSHCAHVSRLDDVHDFLGIDDFYWCELSPEQADEYARLAKSSGWKPATKQVFGRGASYLFDMGRADWLFHIYHPGIRKALDIGSGWGTCSLILARLVDEVWSLENVPQRMAVQKAILEQEGVKNVRLLRADIFGIPFEDSTFDLVVLNGVLEWAGLSRFAERPDRLQEQLLDEVYRVLKPGGVLYIGIENRLSAFAFLGDTDHSGLPFTSLLPRRLADVVTRAWHPSDWRGSRRWPGYRTYTYTWFGYKKMLRRSLFRHIDFFWVLPGYSRPTWSGSLAERAGLRFVVRSLGEQGLLLQHPVFWKRLARRILLSRVGKAIICYAFVFVQRWFVPHFLIFAYKGDKSRTITDNLQVRRTHRGWVLRSRAGDINKVTLFSVDGAGRGLTAYHLNRFRELHEGIDKEKLVRVFNDLGQPCKIDKVFGHTIVGVPFVGGKVLCPFDAKQSLLAVDWLINFQIRCSRPRLEVGKFEEFIEGRILGSRRSLLEKLVHQLHEHRYSPGQTHEHGTFKHDNVFVDNGRVYVVDWEQYSARGDELFDMATFVLNWYFEDARRSSGISIVDFIRRREVRTVLERFCSMVGVPWDVFASYLPIAAARLEARLGGAERTEVLRFLELTADASEVE